MTIQDIFKAYPTRFKADKAGDYASVVHFVLSDDTQGSLQYTVKIQNGSCEVIEGLEDTPQCTIKAKVQTYLDIELGKLNPQTALINGDLQIDNLMEMLNFGRFFKRLELLHTSTITKATTSRKPQSGPLQGLKVLDLTRLLPGPLATMLMADMGAEVIKIEAPDFQDYSRDFDVRQGDESAFYLAYNRSKRSLALDYSHPAGKEVFYELVQNADIVIEQFRPEVMARMGLDYESLRAINEKIIYVSITGYGQTGPYAHLAGHDLNYITLAGLLAGNQYSAPQIPTIQIADIAGGSYMAVIACLSAIFARNSTGKGQFIDVAMMDAALPLNINPLTYHWATQQSIAREENFLAGALLNYGIYPCKDGRYVALATLEVKFWEKFCETIGKPEWKKRMLVQNKNELMQYKNELTQLFLSQELSYWVELGLKHDLLLNAVSEIAEIENDPQIQARDMVITMEHPKAGTIKGIGVPLKFSETKATPAWTAPILGEDSIAILKENGISDEKIQDLIQKGILKG